MRREPRIGYALPKIWFFYWLLPSLLPRLQRLNVASKRRWIVICFWLQLVVGVALLMVAQELQWWPPVVMWWPPLRLPLFVMGLLAGLLRVDGHAMQAHQDEMQPNHWKSKSDALAATLTLLLLTMPFLLEFGYVSFGDSEDTHDNGYWLELGMAWWWLQLIQSVTFVQGSSVCYRLMPSKLMLALGRLSYALYVVHWPLARYWFWAAAAIREPECLESLELKCKNYKPWWLVPVLSVISLAVAFVANRFVEEPMRKCLRPK